MNEKELYSFVLSIKHPWRVAKVDVDVEAEQVLVSLVLRSNARLCCPICDKPASRYDKNYKRWRHLDTGSKATYVQAEVPRVNCKEHGVNQIPIPWAEPRSRYTAEFEACVIDWLRDTSVSAVARQMGMSWNAVSGIQLRAVDRGLRRRDREVAEPSEHIGIDETSFKKGHEYVTVIHDRDTGAVIDISNGRTKEGVGEYYSSLDLEQRDSIKSVSMDMWPAYINATLEALPNAYEKIAFDKFHVAKYLGDAVDRVRKSEHKELMLEGNDILKGTKYNWLINPENESRRHAREQRALRRSNLRTARAWAIKEHAMCLWHYVSRGWAERNWKQWYGWAIRSRLEPVKLVARTIQSHLWGIINAIVLNADNSLAESINSQIQLVKRRSRGFRSRQSFKMSIYFHLGQLNLYPEGVTDR